MFFKEQFRSWIWISTHDSTKDKPKVKRSMSVLSAGAIHTAWKLSFGRWLPQSKKYHFPETLSQYLNSKSDQCSSFILRAICSRGCKISRPWTHHLVCMQLNLRKMGQTWKLFIDQVLNDLIYVYMHAYSILSSFPLKMMLWSCRTIFEY